MLNKITPLQILTIYAKATPPDQCTCTHSPLDSSRCFETMPSDGECVRRAGKGRMRFVSRGRGTWRGENIRFTVYNRNNVTGRLRRLTRGENMHTIALLHHGRYIFRSEY